jgi:hypothetical protein
LHLVRWFLSNIPKLGFVLVFILFNFTRW